MAVLPAIALIAFFIATDPSSGCMMPTARWLFGIGVGLFSHSALLAFHDSTHVLMGMAGAVLLMNAAAPWLDALCMRPHPTRSITIPSKS
jgi:electron transport complex protein RnfD